MGLPILFLLQSVCVPVQGDRVLAGDLAPHVSAFRRLDPASFVAYAPAPGLERRLGRAELRKALGAPADEAELPPAVCMVRAVRRLEENEIMSAMRKVLPADAELVILRGPPAPLPTGRPEFSVTGLRISPQQNIYLWKGRLVPDGGGRSVPVAAVVRIQLRRRVLVAARAIESGGALVSGDLASEWRDVGLPAPPDPPAPEALAGWRTRRRLEAGQVVDASSLLPPPAAHAGQAVTLVCESGSARIAVQAEALTAGRLGDIVFVKSALNGKRIRARLTGPGLAVAEGRLK